MVTEDIKIQITADDKASGVLNNVGKSAGGLTNILGPLGKVAGVAAVAGFGALVAGAISSVKAFDEAQLATKQMEAVLKSTGGAAGLFIEDLQDQAKALQQVTMFSDEAVMGAQNLLLTFTQIKGPVFQEATQTVLDMSQALGQDLKSSSIQLGKALNDPIQGITALSRVGVSFDDTQKKMIETMVNAGDTMGAQRIILAELSKEFGGSAVAAADTFSGKMTILQNAFGELQETVGAALVTAITPFITDLSAWASKPETQERVQQITESFGRFIEQVGPIVKTLLPALIFIFKEVGKEIAVVAKFFFKDLPDAIGTAIFAIQRIINKVQEMVDKIQRAIDKLKSLLGMEKGASLNPFSSSFKLPGFATGGVVPGAMGEPQLAVVHGGERVIPAGQASSSGVGSRSGFNIYITGTFLSEDAAERLTEIMVDRLKLELRI